MSQSVGVAERPARPDYYAILGLPRDGRRLDVSRAYWALARKYHALAAREPHAREMLRELNEAAEVLGSPARRRDYDALRAPVMPGGPDAGAVAARADRRAARVRRYGVFVALLAVAVVASSPAIARARMYDLKTLPGASVTSAPVVFLGDSVTGGAGASSPASAFTSLLEQRLDSAGYASGPADFDTAISALGGQIVDLRFSQDIGRRPRSLVVVEVGAHSVLEDPRLSLEDYATGYGLMLDCLQGSGAEVVVSTIPWLAWDPSGPAYVTAAARSEVIREEAALRGIPVADLWTALKDRGDLLSADGLHPSDAGHRLIADLYWLQMQPLLGRAPRAFAARCDYDRLLALRSLHLDGAPRS